MKQLNTIQKLETLNDIFALDEPGPGGAHHLYQICRHGTARISEEAGDTQEFRTRPENMLATIQMQCGSRRDKTSIHGVIDTDLLEIVRDRLISFQEGPFHCPDNAMALIHVEEALLWLNKRVEDRATRGVLGTEQE